MIVARSSGLDPLGRLLELARHAPPACESRVALGRDLGERTTDTHGAGTLGRLDRIDVHDGSRAPGSLAAAPSTTLSNCAARRHDGDGGSGSRAE